MPKKSTARFNPRANRETGPMPFRPMGTRTPQIHAPVVEKRGPGRPRKNPLPAPIPGRVIRSLGRIIPGQANATGGVIRSTGRPFVTKPVPPGQARVNGAQPQRIPVQRGPLTPIQQQVPKEKPTAGPRSPAQPPVVVSQAPVVKPIKGLAASAPTINVGQAEARLMKQERNRRQAAPVKWTPPAWNGDETPTFRG